MASETVADAPEAGELTKTASSDYYKWSSEIERRRKELEDAGVDIAPKKVEGDKPPLMRMDSGSAWNSGGTWEERDISDWAKERLREALLAWTSGSLSVASIDTLTGESSIVYVRGKVRPGYDLKLKAKLTYDGGDAGTAAVTLTCDELCSDDVDDYELSFSSKSKAACKAAALSAARAAEADVRACIAAWAASLKEYGR